MIGDHQRRCTRRYSWKPPYAPEPEDHKENCYHQGFLLVIISMSDEDGLPSQGDYRFVVYERGRHSEVEMISSEVETQMVWDFEKRFLGSCTVPGHYLQKVDDSTFSEAPKLPARRTRDF